MMSGLWWFSFADYYRLPFQPLRHLFWQYDVEWHSFLSRNPNFWSSPSVSWRFHGNLKPCKSLSWPLAIQHSCGKCFIRRWFSYPKLHFDGGFPMSQEDLREQLRKMQRADHENGEVFHWRGGVFENHRFSQVQGELNSSHYFSDWNNRIGAILCHWPIHFQTINQKWWLNYKFLARWRVIEHGSWL